MHIPYTPAADPLGQTAPLADSLTAPLLGVPVAYSSNSPAVIAAAARALAPWRELPPELVAPGPPARVAVVVHPLGPGEPEAPPAAGEAGGRRLRFVVRAHGDSFLAASGGNLLSAQLAAGVATAFVTPELAADEAGLRQDVIERLGLLLVSQRDRTPVRAAAVVRGGRAVLLVGPGGSGKSTLCYACVRAGLALLAEDTVSVSLEGGLRLWGHPARIHLPPDAPRRFPELAGLAPQVRADGGLALAVDVAALGPGLVATHAERAVVCLVERAAGQASRLAPIDAGEAAAALGGPGEPVLAPLRARGPAVARALAAGGAYRLTVGADPAAAAALIAHLAER